jgi:hypothetical protein
MAAAERRTRRARFRVVYHRSDGWWAASIPAVPGVFSQGRTKAEAYRNVMLALVAAAHAYAVGCARVTRRITRRRRAA